MIIENAVVPDMLMALDWRAKMTLGDRLENYKGIGPGFDHLRIGLAVSILLWHSFGVVHGIDWTKSVNGYILAILSMLLPMFFGLSGFLIMGSAIRTHNVKVFIIFRVLRIFPALVVEVLLSAVILGAVVTNLPLREYFTHPQFWSYFGILIGAIRYWLPGVFSSNPIDITNAALWTVGPEILCYCLVAGMMLTGAFVRKGPMVFCAIIFLTACIATDHFDKSWDVTHLPTKSLIFSFISGNIIFLYRNSIPYSMALFLASLVLSLISVIIAQNFIHLRSCLYIASFLIPYCSAYVGLTNFGKIPFFSRGDYSYGIYIYGFPIQQAIAFFLPEHRVWWINFGLALPFATAFAVMSWHFIEKPTLALRKVILPAADALEPKNNTATSLSRKIIMLLAISAYGLFVMNAARVFPLRNIYETLTGKPSAIKSADIKQF